MGCPGGGGGEGISTIRYTGSVFLGAPNENIVQNHLNIESLNVF